jgi:hypothetical protein
LYSLTYGKEGVTHAIESECRCASLRYSEAPQGRAREINVGGWGGGEGTE